MFSESLEFRKEELNKFDSKYIGAPNEQEVEVDVLEAVNDFNIEMGEQKVDEKKIQALEDQIKDPEYKKIFSNLSNDEKTIYTALHGLSIEMLKRMLLLQERVGRKKHIAIIHGLRNRLSLLYFTDDPKYKELEGYIKEISQ